MFPLAVTSAAPWVAIELLLVPMVLPEPTTNVAVFEISCPLPLTLPASLISCIWYCLILSSQSRTDSGCRCGQDRPPARR